MMRVVPVAALIGILAGAAAAQEAAAPAVDDQVAVAVERVRADFNARLVDYDMRIRALEARVDALQPAAPEAAPVQDGAPPAN